MDKEKTQNITITVPESQVDWLDRKAFDSDTNRSHIARKVFREVMEIEELEKSKKVRKPQAA